MTEEKPVPFRDEDAAEVEDFSFLMFDTASGGSVGVDVYSDGRMSIEIMSSEDVVIAGVTLRTSVFADALSRIIESQREWQGRGGK